MTILNKKNAAVRPAALEATGRTLWKSSLFLAVISVAAIQLSYLTGGIFFLDALGLFLIPAFALFFCLLCREWPQETKDFRVALILMLVCMGISLFVKSHFEVGTVDDDYHSAKIVAYSIRNAFEYKIKYFPPGGIDTRFYIIDFVESVWGIFWRWTRWDFVVVVLQNLPLLVLWRALVSFIRLKGAGPHAGLLALATVLSLQVFWCQQASGYVDGTAGIFTALVFIESYFLLMNEPGPWPLGRIWGLACVSSLAMISKTSLLVVGLFGMAVAVWSARRHLDQKSFFLVVLTAGLGFAYFCYHQYHVWQLSGSPFYPWWEGGAKGFVKMKKRFEGMHSMYYRFHPVYLFLRDHGLNFKPCYVLVSWLLDYKYRHWITPDPWVGGNGVLWTYTVPPTLFFVGIGMLRKPQTLKVLLRPPALILAVFIFHYFFLDVSTSSRFMLGFHAFILAWCLATVAVFLTASKKKILHSSPRIVAWLGVVIALVSFRLAINGDMMRPGQLSVLAAQYRLYPHFISPSDYAENQGQ